MSEWSMLLHSAQQEKLSDPDRELVFYDQPFDTDQLSQLTKVHLWSPHDAPIDRLPEIIASMTRLMTLSIGPGNISPSIVTQLRQGDLPESLQELFVHTGERPVVWPDVYMPNLTTLHVDGPFRFARSSFPKLRALSIYPLKSLNNVRQGLALPLEELNLLKVPINEEIFGLLEPAGLRRLGLLGGRTLQSLTGISMLSRLESLRLKNLTALGDISELATLQRLETLNIQYCKSITGIAAINDLPALRSLDLVGCGNVGLKTIEQKISTLDWINTGATT